MSFKAISEAALKTIGRTIGEDVTYTPNGGSPVTIRAVFDNVFVDAGGTQSLKPALRIDLNDLEAEPAKGDLVTVATVGYRVEEAHADGYGGSTLILKKT